LKGSVPSLADEPSQRSSEPRRHSTAEVTKVENLLTTEGFLTRRHVGIVYMGRSRPLATKTQVVVFINEQPICTARECILLSCPRAAHSLTMSRR